MPGLSRILPVYGKSRFNGGASLLSGGQTGPGQGNQVADQAASRQRVGDTQRGTYYLLAAAA
jgi:hypothetical protein